MKRIFDLIVAIVALIMLLPAILMVGILIKLTSHGPVLYWSERVGKYNKNFRMPKFRTMKTGAPVVATHLLEDPVAHITPLGSILRKYSLDELPQLWSILIGRMSFVGPRPALFNQYDLIILRNQYGVDKLLPGLTGLAQVNGRDNISIELKVKYDAEYLVKQSFYFDLKILALTFIRVIRHSGVSH